MDHIGGCNCGNIHVNLRLTKPPEDSPIRACTCSSCVAIIRACSRTQKDRSSGERMICRWLSVIDSEPVPAISSFAVAAASLSPPSPSRVRHARRRQCKLLGRSWTLHVSASDARL